MSDCENRVAESGAEFVQATARVIREWARMIAWIDGKGDEDDAMLHNVRGSMIRTADRLEIGAKSLREA